MKYFIDTEFIEGFHKPFLGKRRHFIDLVSIGIVCEDGREYYAISNEFDASKADKWVEQNVLSKLEPPYEIIGHTFPGHFYEHESEPIYKPNPTWKSNKQIAQEIIDFINYPDRLTCPDDVKIYAYFADYDWVLFCSLFGRMIDLPEGWPQYCIDLKQMMEERGLSKAWREQVCPPPEAEHNALEDAKWNMQLHKAIAVHTLNQNPDHLKDILLIRQRIKEQRAYIDEIRQSDRTETRKRELINSASQIKFSLQGQLCELLEENSLL